MRTRTTIAAAAAALTCTAAAVAIGTPTTDAQTAEARQLTLRVKVVDGVQLHRGRPTTSSRLARGDVLLVRVRLFGTDGAAAGSAYTSCVNVGLAARSENALLQCTQTYRLSGGQIVTAGLVRFSQLQDLSVPVVGGSGAYRGARGQVTAGAAVEGFDSVDVLSLDP